jgi:hypothetical protein
VKTYSLTIRNRLVAALIVLGLVGLGAAVLFFGFVLLAGLAATGAVVGTAVAAYNKLRGRDPNRILQARAMDLDPSLEVFPDRDKRELPPGQNG